MRFQVRLSKPALRGLSHACIPPASKTVPAADELEQVVVGTLARPGRSVKARCARSALRLRRRLLSGFALTVTSALFRTWPVFFERFENSHIACAPRNNWASRPPT
jgi:hypothetical protein